MALGEKRQGEWWIACLNRGPEDLDDRLCSTKKHRQKVEHVVRERGVRDRYAEREVALHIHLSGEFRGRPVEDPLPNICVVFEACDPVGARKAGELWEVAGYDGGVPRRVQETVLIRDVEVVKADDELRQLCGYLGRAAPDRGVPGIKWLQLGDACLLAAPKKRNPVGLSREAVRVIGNRELTALNFLFGKGASLAPDGKLDDEVIKGRSEIVDAISESESPVFGGLSEPLDIKEVLLSVFVALGADRVRMVLSEAGDFRAKDVQLTFGPTLFFPAPVESWSVIEHEG
jgi:hypothetical protein